MHMWDCINGSGFGVADRWRQFITFQSQITQLFSTTEVNSPHVILQTECTFSWRSYKMGIFKEYFFLLYQYPTFNKEFICKPFLFLRLIHTEYTMPPFHDKYRLWLANYRHPAKCLADLGTLADCLPQERHRNAAGTLQYGAFQKKAAIGRISQIFNPVILNFELFHCSATSSKLKSICLDNFLKWQK